MFLWSKKKNCKNFYLQRKPSHTEDFLETKIDRLTSQEGDLQRMNSGFLNLVFRKNNSKTFSIKIK